MLTKPEQARRLIEQRLAELDRERKQLQGAIAQLSRDGVGRVRASAPPAKRAKATAHAKRAGRGQREQQLLRSLKAHPDFRVADHARAMGVKPQQLYPILRRLSQRGTVAKNDGRYTVVSG